MPSVPPFGVGYSLPSSLNLYLESLTVELHHAVGGIAMVTVSPVRACSGGVYLPLPTFAGSAASAVATTRPAARMARAAVFMGASRNTPDSSASEAVDHRVEGLGGLEESGIRQVQFVDHQLS